MGEIHKCRLFILGAYLAVKGVCNHYRASSYTADCLILIPHKHIPLFCHGFTAFYRAEHRYIPAPKSSLRLHRRNLQLPAHPQSAPAPLKGRPAGPGYTDRRDAGQTPLPRMLPRQTGTGSSLSLPPDAEACQAQRRPSSYGVPVT